MTAVIKAQLVALLVAAVAFPTLVLVFTWRIQRVRDRRINAARRAIANQGRLTDDELMRVANAVNGRQRPGDPGE